ncbi:hypothetical protein Slin15195_G049790 [Septoria linicola]|uniref:Uncharacterized protein n=1 Tax=Septoria linicola TaxID=215465 RepID=A0A9Q9EI51_9PEZI|nr:hypothetical protein Slin15195_G049790 [Septoria linicola]
MLAVAIKAERTSPVSVDLIKLHSQVSAQFDLDPIQVLKVLSQYFGSTYIENESELPFVIGYIFETMFGSERVAEAFCLRHGGSRLLNTAS